MVCLYGLPSLFDLHAATRTSANYSSITETVDIAGGHSTSASYSSDDSAGEIAGVANVVAPVVVARNGYIGQLYELASLQISATPITLNEGGTRQLGAVPVLDDATTFAVPATAIGWSVQSGPISGINASGLASAAKVYENTAATAQGAFEGKTGTLVLTIVNVSTDDFGSYAADGLPDGWQVQYFGTNNPQGGPGGNPDGDGGSNLEEFGFGTNPAVGNAGTISVTGGVITQLGSPTTRVTNVPGGVQFRALYGRRKDYMAARLTYTVQFSAELTTWVNSAAMPTVIADDGNIEAVTVPYPFFVQGKKARFFRVVVAILP